MVSVESVKVRGPSGKEREGELNDGPFVNPQRRAFFAAAWAWIVCPTVFLLSYVPRLNFVARGVLIGFILWFLIVAIAGKRTLVYPVLVVGIAGWLLYALLIGGFAPDADSALRKWITVTSLVGIAWAIANAMVWSGSVRSWAWAYVLSAFAAYASNYLPIEQYVVSDYDTEVLGRFVGTLGNANAFGRAMVQGFFVGLGLLIFYSKGLQALAVILLMGALGLATIESSSRTAMLGLGIGVAAFYLSLRVRDLFTPLNLAGLVSVTAVIYAVFAYFPLHFETAINRMKIFFSFLGVSDKVHTGERSIEDRVDLANTAIDVWQSNPLGVGLDNFRLYVGTYAHSNFLEVLVSTGLLGVILYYSPLLFFCGRQIALGRGKLGSSWLLYSSFIGLMIMVMDLFNVSYYSKTFWVFVGIVSGMAILKFQTDQSNASRQRSALHPSSKT